MIAKMKKLTFLIYHKEYDTFLKEIQELGVLHVETSQEGFIEPSPQLEEKMRQTAHLYEVIEQLTAYNVPVDTSVGKAAGAEEYISKIDGLNNALHAHELTIQKLKKEADALAPWGEFSPEDVNRLKMVGYEMNLYICPKKDFRAEWEEQYNAMPVNEAKGRLYFVTVTPVGAQPDVDAELVRCPQTSLSGLEQQIQSEEQACRQIQDELLAMARLHLQDLRQLDNEWRSSLAFDQVVLGTTHAAGDKLMVLQGWIPADKEAALTSFLSGKDVYYECRNATKADNAPILLKNNAFTRMYEVLTGMYGMPEYGEFDPTPLIAPFFTLFFAFCMGDSGYGLVLIALGFFLKHKLSKSLAGMMNRVITLGIATTVVGAILGTFFGVSLFDVSLPDWMKQFMIVGKIGETSYDKQMLLALIIGVVHICIAMTVKAICSTVRYGFKESLSNWGWLLLVVGFVCTGGLSFMKVISEEVTTTAFIVIGGISAIGIYLLNNIHRNVFVNIGAGLWDTYNMATGLLGDVLSYIRLYALGLAGGMLGGVFNQLAFMVQDAAGGIAGIIFCTLILVFGHTLNIAMSCLSAFVHPLRLTFVEYFKNSGYEGKGEAYKPFAVIKNNK